MAFRFIAANQHPGHGTIATFRRRFLKQIEALFEQVLGVAREMGVLKLGIVALDGTKMHANASRHSALSYEHANKIEAQLKGEVADLLGRAEAADNADVPDGMSIPEELARREKRLAEIARATVVIEARAKERHAREQAEYEAKIAAREAKTAQTGKKPGGRVPQPPQPGPCPPIKSTSRTKNRVSCQWQAAGLSNAITLNVLSCPRANGSSMSSFQLLQAFRRCQNGDVGPTQIAWLWGKTLTASLLGVGSGLGVGLGKARYVSHTNTLRRHREKARKFEK